MGWVAAAGLVVSAFGTYQQSKAAQDQANYQAQVSENNAVIAQQNAARIAQDSVVAQDEQRERIQRTKGSASAQLAASGLLVDDTEDSTVQNIFQDIEAEGALDVLRIRDKYEGEERRAQVQGMNFMADAGLQRAKAGSINPLFNAGGTLLEGAGSVYSTGKTQGNWT